jgi:hypothetical protein
MGEITMNPWVTEDLVYRLYYSSCIYSAGNLDQDLITAIMGAYSEGPEGMRELARTLAAEKSQPGWQLPNPQFHSLVVNVERGGG